MSVQQMQARRRNSKRRSNAFDDFTAPQFEAFVDDVTLKIRRGLGLEAYSDTAVDNEQPEFANEEVSTALFRDEAPNTSAPIYPRLPSPGEVSDFPDDSILIAKANEQDHGSQLVTDEEDDSYDQAAESSGPAQSSSASPLSLPGEPFLIPSSSDQQDSDNGYLSTASASAAKAVEDALDSESELESEDSAEESVALHPSTFSSQRDGPIETKQPKGDSPFRKPKAIPQHISTLYDTFRNGEKDAVKRLRGHFDRETEDALYGSDEDPDLDRSTTDDGADEEEMAEEEAHWNRIPLVLKGKGRASDDEEDEAWLQDDDEQGCEAESIDSAPKDQVIELADDSEVEVVDLEADLGEGSEIGEQSMSEPRRPQSEPSPSPSPSVHSNQSPRTFQDDIVTTSPQVDLQQIRTLVAGDIQLPPTPSIADYLEFSSSDSEEDTAKFAVLEHIGTADGQGEGALRVAELKHTSSADGIAEHLPLFNHTQDQQSAMRGTPPLSPAHADVDKTRSAPVSPAMISVNSFHSDIDSEAFIQSIHADAIESSSQSQEDELDIEETSTAEIEGAASNSTPHHVSDYLSEKRTDASQPALGNIPIDTRGVEEEGIPVTTDAVSSENVCSEPRAPQRANVIAPGLFDPSEPIVFGGSSIEAAVREALHDPSRQSIARDALHAMTETDPRAAPLLDMDDSMIQEEQAVEEIPSRIATDATHFTFERADSKSSRQTMIADRSRLFQPASPLLSPVTTIASDPSTLKIGRPASSKDGETAPQLSNVDSTYALRDHYAAVPDKLIDPPTQPHALREISPVHIVANRVVSNAAEHPDASSEAEALTQLEPAEPNAESDPQRSASVFGSNSEEERPSQAAKRRARRKRRRSGARNNANPDSGDEDSRRSTRLSARHARTSGKSDGQEGIRSPAGPPDPKQSTLQVLSPRAESEASFATASSQNSPEKILAPQSRKMHGHGPRMRSTFNSSPTSSAPVTRSKCHYKKLAIQCGQAVITFAVPECSMAGKQEEMQRSQATDVGECSASEHSEAVNLAQVESGQINEEAIAALSRICGTDLLHECEFIGSKDVQPERIHDGPRALLRDKRLDSAPPKRKRSDSSPSPKVASTPINDDSLPAKPDASIFNRFKRLFRR